MEDAGSLTHYTELVLTSFIMELCSCCHEIVEYCTLCHAQVNVVILPHQELSQMEKMHVGFFREKRYTSF